MSHERLGKLGRVCDMVTSATCVVASTFLTYRLLSQTFTFGAELLWSDVSKKLATLSALVQLMQQLPLSPVYEDLR